MNLNIHLRYRPLPPNPNAGPALDLYYTNTGPKMSGAAPSSGSAPSNTKTATAEKSEATKEIKPAAALEEDDEFEDFPVESRFSLSAEGSNADGVDRLDTRRGGGSWGYASVGGELG